MLPLAVFLIFLQSFMALGKVSRDWPMRMAVAVDWVRAAALPMAMEVELAVIAGVSLTPSPMKMVR